MKNILKIFSLLSLLIFTSCDEDFFQSTVEIEIPEHIPTLAVSGVLTEGIDSVRVFVTQSQSINDLTDPEPVIGAEVRLFKNNNLLPAFAENGNFFETVLSPGDLEAGSTYRLEVSHPDFETVTSTQIMPTKTEITAFDFEKDGSINQFGDIQDELSIEFTDDVNEENYYMVQFIEEGQEIDWNEDTLQYYDVRAIETRDPNVVYGFIGYFGFSFGSSRVPMFSDATFNGKKYTAVFSSYSISDNWFGRTPEKLTAYLVSISRERYLYLLSLNTYYDSEGNPFAEPVNVAGNIENGLGAFGAQALDSLVVKF